MAGVNTEKRQRRRHLWRKNSHRLSRRLLCCSCLPCEERNSLQEQEMKINGAPQNSHLDQSRSGEAETIQITVEDLGIVNASFSLLDEEPQTPRNNLGRSASSVSASAWALKKKGLRPLSSLSIQTHNEPTVSREDDEDEDEDALMYDSGTDSTPASGSLLSPAPPVITLIPPTPSDVVDDDQFFEINSEESESHTCGSDGSLTAGDHEVYEHKTEGEKSDESDKGRDETGTEDGLDNSAGLDQAPSGLSEDGGEAVAPKEKSKPTFSRSAYQVPPLPGLPQTRSFNTGINLLSFTEHNLDDLSSRDVTCSDILKAEFRLLPNTANMDTATKEKRQITRSCSLEDSLSRSTTFHTFGQTTDHRPEDEGSPRQRRVTVASCMNASKDQNGNFAKKDVDRQIAKCLRELNTDELCQWFTNVGLHKCLPLIKEAQLCGADMASVDANTLDILQVTSLEDREQLLSAIYTDLHPPSTFSRRLDSLIESSSQSNVETFTATLASMTKSTSAPHVGCLALNRRSLNLRNKNHNYMIQRNSQLIEVTINASEQIVHLRTPNETTVGKIMDSCMKMLNLTEDKSLFSLKGNQGSSDLPADQQIGSLLTSEKRQLELCLHKTGEKTASAAVNGPDMDSTNDNISTDTKVQEDQSAREERMKELHQQVDSLHNVIRQVQELHQSLVEFCAELKSMDKDADVELLGSAELKQRLESASSRLSERRQSLQCLKGNANNSAARHSKQLDVQLLEKMKFNCQVFKEEITIVHLGRQVAHLQNALQGTKEKARTRNLAIHSFSQLVAPHSTAMFLVLEENQGPDGRYGFTCGYTEDRGLVVVKAENTELHVDDRLVEVNGTPVLNFTLEEVTDLLQQGPRAQVVVLRQPPPAPPRCQEHPLGADPTQVTGVRSDAVSMETVPRRKVVAI